MARLSEAAPAVRRPLVLFLARGLGPLRRAFLRGHRKMLLFIERLIRLHLIRSNSSPSSPKSPG